MKPSFSSEYVTVQLLKSVPGGMAPVGEIIQWVPLKPGGRATGFIFSYTFTPQDAEVGKVTFKAVTVIVGYYLWKDTFVIASERSERSNLDCRYLVAAMLRAAISIAAIW